MQNLKQQNNKIQPKKSSSSNVILQLIQIKVYDFNTLLVQENVQSVGILRLRGTHISRECVLLETQ